MKNLGFSGGVVILTTAQLHSTKPKLKILRWFKSCSRRVGESQWWGSLTMAPAGNKAKRLSSVDRATKTIHHHHFERTELEKKYFLTWAEKKTH